MTISEDYVSFETAQLLKEGGFEEYCEAFYRDDGILNEFVGNYNHIEQDKEKPHYSAAEHWQVLKWLRIKHNIWVEILLFDIGWLERGKFCFQWRVYNNTEEWETNTTEYKTPEETTEAAISYTLKNLIK